MTSLLVTSLRMPWLLTTWLPVTSRLMTSNAKGKRACIRNDGLGDPGGLDKKRRAIESAIESVTVDSGLEKHREEKKAVEMIDQEHRVRPARAQQVMPQPLLRAGHVDMTSTIVCTDVKDVDVYAVADWLAGEVNRRLLEHTARRWHVRNTTTTTTSKASSNSASSDAAAAVPGGRHGCSSAVPSSSAVLLLEIVGPHSRQHHSAHHEALHEGSFSLVRSGDAEPGTNTQNNISTTSPPNVVVLRGADNAGLRVGAKRLLRELYMPPPPNHAHGLHEQHAVPSHEQQAIISVPGNLSIQHGGFGGTAGAHARWEVRGQQIPADHHPMQFRTQNEFAMFANDLSVFGTYK